MNIFPEQPNFDPFNFYKLQKHLVNIQTKVFPYEENDDPNEGEIYSCWISDFSLITIKVNYKNQYIYTDESIL
jgi:hypothetical protein